MSVLDADVTASELAPGRQADGELVGRESELAALAHELASLTDGCRTVHITGEPGIGKTALIDAALAQWRHETIRCSADPHGEPKAMEVLLRGLYLRPAEAAAEHLLAESIIADLGRRLDRGPTVLVIDSVQWSDQATLRLLPRICSAFQRRPFLLITAGQCVVGSEKWRLLSALGRQSVSTELTVAPLDEPASAELFVQALDADAATPGASAHEPAGGNPALLRRLAGAWSRRPGTGAAPDAGEVTLPVSQIPHLAHLSPDCLRFLGFAAVLGLRFEARQLCSLTGTAFPELVRLVGEAVTWGLLAETDAGLGFRHEIVRSTLASEVPAIVHAELHRSGAQELTDGGADPVLVADHLCQSTLVASDYEWVTTIAAGCVTAAPDRALRLLRHYVASAHFTDRDDPRLVEIIAQMAQLQLSLGDICGAATTARQVLEQAGVAPGALRACLEVSLMLQGRNEEAQMLAGCGEGSDELQPWERADQAAIAGAAAMRSGNTATAAATLERADRAALATGSVVAHVRILVARGHMAHCDGDLAEAVRLLEKATRLSVSDGSRTTDETFAHAALGLALSDGDQTRRAEDAFCRGAEIARGRGSIIAARVAELSRASVDVSLGRLDRAMTGIDEILTRPDAVALVFRPALLARRAMAALHCEGPDAAERVLGRLSSEDVPADQEYGMAWRHRAMAAVRLARGDVDDALLILWDAWQGVQAAGIVIDTRLLATEIVDASRRTKDVAKAWAVAEALDHLAARNPDVRSITVQKLTVRGMIEGDRNLLMAATEVAAGVPHRLVAARAYEEAAIALIEAGSPRDAGRISRDALERYSSMGAAFEAARARAAFRRAGIRVREPARGRPRAGWEALTPAEQVVAHHVERGLSNADIADELVVSRRTVETHVSHILAKLNLRSRADMILAAGRRGDGKSA